jgi:hypothetical protein
MAIVSDWTCKNCCWWLGDREGGPHTKGDCKVLPTKTQNKDIDDQCSLWRNCALIRGGYAVDPPEHP